GGERPAAALRPGPDQRRPLVPRRAQRQARGPDHRAHGLRAPGGTEEVNMRGLHGLSALGLTAALATSAAAQAPDPRSELEVMAHALELAVSKVSRPVGWTFVPDGDSA